MSNSYLRCNLLKWFYLSIFLFVVSSFAAAQANLEGEWRLSTVMLGQIRGDRLTLHQKTGELSGDIYRGGHVPLQGTINNAEVHFTLKDGDGSRNEYAGRMNGDNMSGDYKLVAEAGYTITGTWSARRPPAKPANGPQVHDFAPSEYHREMSSTAKPVLHLWPGDTLHTTSIDAGGSDQSSAVVSAGGDPLTGPFYIEGAMPGDLLVVKINKLRLNRDWAISDKGLVSRAMTQEYRARIKPDFTETRWRLDREKGTATPEKPSENLKNLVLTVHPMLGGIGVAPRSSDPPIPTIDSGYAGGNLDFTQICEGTTIYLPVLQPGALLYVGDGHALQGDGELNGVALETSLDIELTVDVVREKSISGPRAEDKDYLMSFGLSGSLDAAFSRATSDLAIWLQNDYNLPSADVAELLGTSIQYNIAEVADRNVAIVAKFPKRVLAMIPHK
jgi:acetamidase/formamidase